jgi:hypothetical protein
VGLQKCQHPKGEDLSELAAVTSGFSDDLEYMALTHVPNSAATALQQWCSCSTASTSAAHMLKNAECSTVLLLRAAQHEWHMGFGIESYFTAAHSVAEKVPPYDFLHPIVAGKLNLDLLSTLLEG